MKHTILIWGTGERAKKLLDRGCFDACETEGFVDTYQKGSDFMGRPVYRPEEAAEIMSYVDYMVIANEYFEEILEQCRGLEIDTDKLVLTDNVQAAVLRELFLRLEAVSPELFQDLQTEPMGLVKRNESDQKDPLRLLGRGRYAAPAYMQDYFRYRTFELAAREITENGVEGAVAELGVFRGFFSSIINELFRERKLYLFDTFEGFDSAEAKSEITRGRCDERFVSAYRDTSVERVLCALPNPQKAVVCKGLFPASVPKEAADETYAFVSLDVDFEESTYQGLHFFYPRLSEGGMIFIHDYNTFFLEGVRAAVKRFEDASGKRLKKLPLADRAGTLVILK